MQAGIQDVEPPAQIVRLPGLAGTLGQQEDGALQGQGFNLGLGKKPLRAVGIGDPQILDLAANVGIVAPCDHRKNPDQQRKQRRHQVRGQVPCGRAVLSWQSRHGFTVSRSSCQMLRE